jgi:pyochelin biosynthetic protein PchC
MLLRGIAIMNERASLTISGQSSLPSKAGLGLPVQNLAWLRRYTKNAVKNRDPVALICFPHAGGAASAFVGWRELIPENWILFAVKYPGREDRFTEPHATSITDIVDAVAAEVKAVIPASMPMVFFGHSMGSVVAYETAHVLSQSGRAPGLLTVSAESPEDDDDGWFSSPDSSDTAKAGESHRQFIAKRIAGLDPNFSEIAKFPEIRDYAVSLVNADISACDNYSMTPDTLDSVPILALSGQDDPAMKPEDVNKWRAYSTGPFRSRSFPGGHFYLRDEARRVVDTLVETANLHIQFASNDKQFSSAS